MYDTDVRGAAEAPALLTRHEHGLAPCAACHIWHCSACGCMRRSPVLAAVPAITAITSQELAN